MLAYLATKEQFLLDAHVIEDKVRDAVRENLHIGVSPNELNSWRNSLGNAMVHVMNSPKIPSDVGVAIEYQINKHKNRIDFIVSGKNSLGLESIVIIELKQWTDIEFSFLPEHVKTFVGKKDREVLHPAYQARSYASLLEMYNQYVYETPVGISSCAYLHNALENRVVNDSRYEEALRNTPVFIHGEKELVVDLIASNISEGDGIDLLRRVDASPTRPSLQLADAISNMLQGKEAFILIDNQKTVLETIVHRAYTGLEGKKQVVIVNGGPGTGKSVVAINALSRLMGQRMNARYVTPNAAPRAVFEVKLKDSFKGGQIKELFSGSGSYTGLESDEFDILIVDEAHRLKLRTQYSKGGDNQIREIIHASRTSVFFLDESQKVTWKDIGEVAEIEKFAESMDAEVTHLVLESQFRCNGSDGYIEWLDQVLGISTSNSLYLPKDEYDFQVFDNPSVLYKSIRERNIPENKSRMLAGYCWNWVSKNDHVKFDISFPEFDFEAKWNLETRGSAWIIDPESIEDIGCIHTSQGLELDYVGVIIGPDFTMKDGKLVSDPAGRASTDVSLHGYKKEFGENPVEASAKADRIIRNTYRTLMTRGMKGCYIYCTNPEVADYFRALLFEEVV
ncbi:DEXSc_RecD-like domain containing protein [Candidatus Planktophila dulcis]|uniref:DNA/RNA helicase domain-containing protein n=1 Tax=Candidatus Planktophila dulcis TaxID=1884914 RepID=UPI003BEED5AC